MPQFETIRRALLVAMAPFAVFISGNAASAHDFWIQPATYWFATMTAPMTLQVGHGTERQRSAIPLRRITRFEAIGPDDTVIDLRDFLALGEKSKDGDLLFSKPGTYVLLFETDNKAQSHLPADRFNAHLKAEGLTPALERRARTRGQTASGSELYGRRAKAIVQVGPVTAKDQGHVIKLAGMSLEIITEANPYAMPRPRSLPVRVYYQGKPLPGALVKLTNLDSDEKPSDTDITDAEGRSSFDMPQTGRWLLTTAWTKALPANDHAEFETIFSSLNFGFDQGAECDPI